MNGPRPDYFLSDIAYRILFCALDETWAQTLAEIRGLPERERVA
jgi:hypothetical protein